MLDYRRLYFKKNNCSLICFKILLLNINKNVRSPKSKVRKPLVVKENRREDHIRPSLALVKVLIYKKTI